MADSCSITVSSSSSNGSTTEVKGAYSSSATKMIKKTIDITRQ